MSGALFQMNWSGIQQRIIVPVCFLPTTVNAGNARIRGAELEGSLRPLDGLELSFGLGYQSPRIMEPGLSGLLPGSRILQVPDFTGNVALRYTHSVTQTVKGYLSTDFSYTSSSLSATTSSQFGVLERAGFGIWNARMGAEWGRQTLELYVKNITNAEPNIGDIYPVGYPQLDTAGNPIPRVAVLPPLQIGLQFEHGF
jgi:outer membrane receptor protein involved in Fe transport